MKKKILLTILILFIGMTAFAQNWEFWGELATGFRIEHFGGGEDWYGPKFEWVPKNVYNPEGPWHWELTGRDPYDTSISMFNWFMGSYLEFSARYTRGNYGIKTTLWLNFFNNYPRHWGNDKIDLINLPLDIWSVYGWLDLYYDQLRFTFGRMWSSDDNVWVAPGVWDADHNYSLGDGLRIEYKPMLVEGLNVGVSMFVPPYMMKDVWSYFDPQIEGTNGRNIFTGRWENVYQMTTNPSGWMGGSKNAKFRDFLRNIAFGMQYESETFNMAAGFKVNSRGEGLTDSDWGETYFGFAIWQLLFGPEGPFDSAHLLNLPYDFPWTGYDVILEQYRWAGRENTLELLKGGAQGYMGFDLNMFGPFRFKAGARIYNIGVLREFGWMWVNQELTYTTLEPLVATFGLDLHQRIYFMDNATNEFARRYEDDHHTILSARKPILFTIIPRWDAFLNNFCYVGIKAPIKFWPGIINLDLTVIPKIGYMWGDGLFGKTCYLELEYWFNYIVFSKYGNFFSDAGNGRNDSSPPYRDSHPLMRHTVQINFKIVY